MPEGTVNDQNHIAHARGNYRTSLIRTRSQAQQSRLQGRLTRKRCAEVSRAINLRRYHLNGCSPARCPSWEWYPRYLPYSQLNTTSIGFGIPCKTVDSRIERTHSHSTDKNNAMHCGRICFCWGAGPCIQTLDSHHLVKPDFVRTFVSSHAIRVINVAAQTSTEGLSPARSIHIPIGTMAFTQWCETPFVCSVPSMRASTSSSYQEKKSCMMI